MWFCIWTFSFVVDLFCYVKLQNVYRHCFKKRDLLIVYINCMWCRFRWQSAGKCVCPLCGYFCRQCKLCPQYLPFVGVKFCYIKFSEIYFGIVCWRVRIVIIKFTPVEYELLHLNIMKTNLQVDSFSVSNTVQGILVGWIM